MKSAVLSQPKPVLVTDKKVWLDVCGWKVPAGFASPAGDHTRKRIDLNDHLIRNADATSVNRVKADSMIDIGLYAGDSLLIDRSIEPKHGDIVLAVLNNEFTLKRLYRKGGAIKLVPENQRYPTIVVKPEEEFSVWGVVTYNLHKLY